MKTKMCETIDRIIGVGEELGWKVDFEELVKNDVTITFYQYSPAGQDFLFSVVLRDGDSIYDFAHTVYRYYEDFEPEAETMLWLDSDGHGVNGAPYHMRDVLEDMEACEKMIEDLAIALGQYKKHIN